MRELPMNAKIVIVGGGIVGASVAYHLAAKGVTDVVLLEQNTMTSGTTWHAAGLVGQLRATQNMTRLASYGAELYEQLELDGFPTGFRRTGSIAVANNEERLEELVRGADMASCFDIDIQHVDVDTLASHWPLMHTDDLIGGVWVPRDGQTSPVDTTMALAKRRQTDGRPDLREHRRCRNNDHWWQWFCWQWFCWQWFWSQGHWGPHHRRSRDHSRCCCHLCRTLVSSSRSQGWCEYSAARLRALLPRDRTHRGPRTGIADASRSWQ